LQNRSDDRTRPLENYVFVLTGKAATLRLSTIRGGDFYAENAAPGRYSAELHVEDKTCRLELTVPDSHEIVTDLGELFCETVH
jgi:hypothetical protein